MNSKGSKNWGIVLTLLSVSAFSILLFCPFFGPEIVSLSALLDDPTGTTATVFWQIRVPRVLIGFIAGTGLAACGMAFQALFRNGLATPFTLGVAGGASLGAAVYVQAGISFSILTVSGMSIFAFAGALGAISVVYGLTRLRRGFSAATMLLAGIAVNLFLSSLIMLVQYLSDFTQSFRILRWLMGGLEIMGYEDVFSLAPLVLVSVFVLFALSHELNLLSIDEELAISRGVDAGRVKHILFIATSVCVGSIVAVCGPIGFIGMMAPHICRLLVGGNHRRLLPSSCLFGGLFLVLCDTVARTVIAPAEIPVGVITSVLGGPFFVWLLVHAPAGGLVLGHGSSRAE